MKVRKGFVSNSSSSSFVLMVRKENHEAVLNDLHPYVRKVVLGLAAPTKCFGMDAVTLGWLSVMDYDPLYDEFGVPDDDAENLPQGQYDEGVVSDPKDAVHAYERLLTERFGTAAVFTWSADG